MTENRYSYSKSLFVGRKEQILEFGQALPLRVVSVRLNEYEDLVQKLNAQIKKLEQELEQSKDYNGILYANQNREMRELIEENEQLKERIEKLKEALKLEPFARAEGDITTVKTDYFIGICKENNDLSKENEQLKIQIKNISAQRDEFYQGAMENANDLGKVIDENEELKQELENMTERFEYELKMKLKYHSELIDCKNGDVE